MANSSYVGSLVGFLYVPKIILLATIYSFVIQNLTQHILCTSWHFKNHSRVYIEAAIISCSCLAYKIKTPIKQGAMDRSFLAWHCQTYQQQLQLVCTFLIKRPDCYFKVLSGELNTCYSYLFFHLLIIYKTLHLLFVIGLRTIIFKADHLELRLCVARWSISMPFSMYTCTSRCGNGMLMPASSKRFFTSFVISQYTSQ